MNVSNKSGQAISSAVLSLTDVQDDTLHITVALADDGTFAFGNVPSGTYKLSCTEAKITAVALNAPANVPPQYAPKQTVAAFADLDTSLIVKDSDVVDMNLILVEIPLPKDANTPAPADTDD